MLLKIYNFTGRTDINTLCRQLCYDIMINFLSRFKRFQSREQFLDCGLRKFRHGKSFLTVLLFLRRFLSL